MTHPQHNVTIFDRRETRPINMPDGSQWDVEMPAGLWDDLELLKAVDGVNEGMLGVFALEEMPHHRCTFDEAFRGVVAYLANRWK